MDAEHVKLLKELSGLKEIPMSTKYWEERGKKAIALSTQDRGVYPVLDHSRGDGPWLYDLEGNKYLDVTSGVAVRALGARPPGLVAFEKKIESVIEELPGQDFDAIPQTLLAEKLISICPGKFDKQVFFTTSGGRAVETAVKSAIDQTHKTKFVAFRPAFHGRTGYALALTASKAVHKNFFPQGLNVLRMPYAYCYRCPYGMEPKSCGVFCLEQIRTALEYEGNDIAGIVYEPISGEGGLIVPDSRFLRGLRKIVDDYGASLIADEVQAGLGRSGKWWASEHHGVIPDQICVAKALGGGYPMGATVGKSPMFSEGSRHSETFSAEPRMALVSLFLLNQIDKLRDNALKRGAQLLKGLNELVSKYECCGDARGLGLMIGMEIVENKKTKKESPKIRNELVKNCIKKQKLWILGSGMCSVRFLPRLNSTEEEIDMALEKFRNAVKETSG